MDKLKEQGELKRYLSVDEIKPGQRMVIESKKKVGSATVLEPKNYRVEEVTRRGDDYVRVSLVGDKDQRLSANGHDIVKGGNRWRNFGGYYAAPEPLSRPQEASPVVAAVVIIPDQEAAALGVLNTSGRRFKIVGAISRAYERLVIDGITLTQLAAEHAGEAHRGRKLAPQSLARLTFVAAIAVTEVARRSQS